MIYMYIFEDGSFYLGKEPKEEDFDSVIDGVVDIINMTEQTYCVNKNKWEKIKYLSEMK